MSPAAILYAPNVHTGGGFVLLQALVASWPVVAGVQRYAFLDERARASLELPADVAVHWVRPAIGSRLDAEFALRSLSTAGSTVLCFHGLPPLLRAAARVVVFQQNRNYLGLMPLRSFALRTAVRLAMERSHARWLRHRVDVYVVQTDSMARAVRTWYGRDPAHPARPQVLVRPFIGDALPQAQAPDQAARAVDLLYVSDGVAHKNHLKLIEALELLAQQGLRPSLAVTLGARDQALADEIARRSQASGLLVHNLGHCSREAILKQYESARALVFPSLSESFGLPLIEAQAAGLPIIAAELDYVRDVCTPAETFDPHSAVSMARAIRRFLGSPEVRAPIGGPRDLWQLIETRGADGAPESGHV